MLASPQRFLRSFFHPVFSPGPFVDIFSGKSGVQIQLELPGVKKEDIAIAFEKGALSVTAEKKPVELEGAKRVHAEREFGSLNRVFKLPSTTRLDKLEAVLTNGVLTVSIPKNEEPKIDIKVQ
jgi:HSP20 family protein